MKFGVLKDIKNGEYRVIATPAEVSILKGDGHEVYVASGAGYAAGFDDEEYVQAGAVIRDTNEEIWAECDFVAKVKEIEASEYDLMREGQMIYCRIHPAKDTKRKLTRFWKRKSLPLQRKTPTDTVLRTAKRQAKPARLWDFGL